MINNFSFLSILTGIFTFFLGTFIISRNPKDRNARIIFLFCFLSAFIIFSEIGMRNAPDVENATIWLKLTYISPISATVLFHFCHKYSDKTRTRVDSTAIIVLYIIATIIMVSSIFFGLIDNGVIYGQWGWTYNFRADSLLTYFYFQWSIVLTIIGMYKILKNTFITNDTLLKYQSKIISIGGFLYIITLVIFDFVMPIFFNIKLPEIGYSSVIIFIIFITYAMWKYQLFLLDFSKSTDTIISQIRDSLLIVDLNNKIKKVNTATLKLLNYSEEELIDFDIQKILPPLIVTKNQNGNGIGSEIHSNNSYIIKETNFISKTLQSIPVLLTISFIHDKNNFLYGMLYIARDQTEKKRMDYQEKIILDEALKNLQFKTEIMSSISHELRTPLNSIIGFSDLLLEGSYGELNIKQKEFLDDVKNSSEHLLDLVDDVIDLEKLSSGKVSLKCSNIDLKSIIRQILSTIKPLYSKRGLYFKLEGLDNGTIIYADPVKLKQIFYNLLSNAIKFTYEGGITFKISCDENFWYFYIIDTGIGISKNEIEYIFKPFKRAANSEVQAITGTGLGLSITKKLVELHGGQITVSSVYGSGSNFKVALPILKGKNDNKNLAKIEG